MRRSLWGLLGEARCREQRRLRCCQCGNTDMPHDWRCVSCVHAPLLQATGPLPTLPTSWVSRRLSRSQRSLTARPLPSTRTSGSRTHTTGWLRRRRQRPPSRREEAQPANAVSRSASQHSVRRRPAATDWRAACVVVEFSRQQHKQHSRCCAPGVRPCRCRAAAAGWVWRAGSWRLLGPGWMHFGVLTGVGAGAMGRVGGTRGVCLFFEHVLCRAKACATHEVVGLLRDSFLSAV